ncbi:MAG: hypothetical protein QXF26_08700 [Candidatus Bathyarchaeia archaeon]
MPKTVQLLAAKVTLTRKYIRIICGPHLLAMYAVFLVNAPRTKCRYASVIGLYRWGT